MTSPPCVRRGSAHRWSPSAVPGPVLVRSAARAGGQSDCKGGSAPKRKSRPQAARVALTSRGTLQCWTLSPPPRCALSRCLFPHASCSLPALFLPPARKFRAPVARVCSSPPPPPLSPPFAVLSDQCEWGSPARNGEDAPARWLRVSGATGFRLSLLFVLVFAVVVVVVVLVVVICQVLRVCVPVRGLLRAPPSKSGTFCPPPCPSLPRIPRTVLACPFERPR